MQRKLAAEWLGTFSLLATVIGSGIMAERLAGGNVAIALLGNTIPTGAILVVLITIFGPISGAHFNPAVTLAFALRREIAPRDACLYVVVQVIGGIAGVLVVFAVLSRLGPLADGAHLMQGLRLIGTEGGLGCIQCHDFAGTPSLGIELVEFSHS